MDCFRDGLSIGPPKRVEREARGAASVEVEDEGTGEDSDWQDICESRYRRHFVNAVLQSIVNEAESSKCQSNKGQQPAGGPAEEAHDATARTGGTGEPGVPVSEEDLWLLMSTPPAKVRLIVTRLLPLCLYLDHYLLTVHHTSSAGVASHTPHHCQADDTVYTCFMCPASGRLVTRVECSRAMVRAGKKRFGTIAKASSKTTGAGQGSGAKRQ